MQCHTVPRGSIRKDFPNVFQEHLVRVGFFTVIPSALYNQQTARKFIFKAHELSSIDLRAEGRSIAGTELNTADASEAYRHFNRQFNLYDSNDDVGINLDEYEKYSNIWPFDCTIGGTIDTRQGGERRR